jgi:hypothetical protein
MHDHTTRAICPVSSCVCLQCYKNSRPASAHHSFPLATPPGSPAARMVGVHRFRHKCCISISRLLLVTHCTRPKRPRFVACSKRGTSVDGRRPPSLASCRSGRPQNHAAIPIHTASVSDLTLLEASSPAQLGGLAARFYIMY